MKINVFGIVFTVRLAEIPDNLAGLCDYDRKKIYISHRQSIEEVWTTLLHELGHALMIRSGVAQSVSNDVIEIIVENYSRMLAEIISVGERDRILSGLKKKKARK